MFQDFVSKQYYLASCLHYPAQKDQSFKLQGSLSTGLLQVLRFFPIISVRKAFCSSVLLWNTCVSISPFQSDAKKLISGTSLIVQWLRLLIPNAGCLGSIPGQGTKDPTCCRKKTNTHTSAPTMVH